METAVSIIIPAWNEAKIISKTCIFLRKLKLPFKYSELIFVSGGTDNTYNICKKIELKNFDKVFTLKQDHGDFKSGALIKGINKAKGDYIILIDADTLVAINLVVEIVKSLKKFDSVNCNYLPMLSRGFWYNYYIIHKLIWSSNPKNLPYLFGATPISLKKEVFNEIGIENFFTNKSTAGVDYYIGMILKKNNKRIGFVKNTCVITPRPNNIIDYSKDQLRWLSAFIELNQGEKWFILSNLIRGVLLFIFPPILFLYYIVIMKKCLEKKYLKLKYFFTFSFVEYLRNILRIIAIIRKLARKQKQIGHFKGPRYY